MIQQVKHFVVQVVRGVFGDSGGAVGTAGSVFERALGFSNIAGWLSLEKLMVASVTRMSADT